MKYKQYQKMKDSGVEWIGEIPEHWEVKPLFVVCKNNKEKNDGNKVSNVLSLSYGKIIRRDVESNFGLLPASFETYQIIDDGYIVLRLTDLQNDKRSLRVGLVTEKGIITSAYTGLKTNHGMNSGYLYNLLHSYDIEKVFYNLGSGVRQTMNFSDLRRLPLLIPPKIEGDKIYDFLKKETSNFDDLISKSKQQVNLLQEKRQALITHAVTKGLDPTVSMKDSGVEWIGKIPEHWEVRPLQMVASVLDPFPSHRAPSITDDGFPYPGIGDLDKNGNLIGNCRTVSETALKEQESRFKIELGDLAFARVATLGKIIHLRNDFRYCLSPTMAVLKPKINSLYLSYTLEAQYFQEQLIIVSTGSTRHAVGIMTLRKLKVVLPPKEERQQISEFLQKETTQFDDLISKSQLQINFLQEKRQAIIISAVTGKIDVRK